MNFTGGNHVILFKLHWLPISYRVVFKLLLLIFKTLKTVLGFGTWLNYFNTISIPGQFVQILKTYFGSKNPIIILSWQGIFHMCPKTVDSILLDIHKSNSFCTFKNDFKTYLF